VSDRDGNLREASGAAADASPWSAQKHLILVTCAKGIPPFLAKELQNLGYPILRERPAGVETEGTLEDCMRLNLELRTGQRVLFMLQAFEERTPDDMYRCVGRFPWELWLAADGYLSVHSSVFTLSVRDTRFPNLRCKDAIVDRVRAKRGRRPDAGSAQDRFVAFLYWRDRECRLYLDTTAEALARRGYRKAGGEAPMQETLAAAVVLATAWDRRAPFVNPMCGSGTLAIEAALIAMKRAPGLLRDNFGFMHVPGFPRERWQRLRDAAAKSAAARPEGQILASDIDADAVRNARQNAARAGVEKFVEFSVGDFARTAPPAGGVVIMNPEYGARMGEETELKTLYPRIGDFFKQKCQGGTGYVFTGNLELAKTIGLRTSRRIPFFNGDIECRLLQYDLYTGTRRKFAPAETPDGGAATEADSPRRR
jgi:putative N6-adenine-specific DNA methylase